MMINQIDISLEELQLVKNILAVIIPDYKVYVFGSRVTGKSNKSSDLDLIIKTEKPLEILKIADLKDAFSESDLSFKVDVIDWAATNESFRKIIEKDIVPITD